MSVRAAIVRAKQIAAEFLLRQRVLLAVRTQPHQAPPARRSAAAKAQLLTVEASPSNRLQRAFVGFRSSHQSAAAKFRRSAALRLIESRYASSGGRRGGSRARLPVYAFLGLTLAAGETGGLLLVGENDARNENEEKMRRLLPLETCCEIVRDFFRSQDSHQDQDFPSDTSAYDISKQLLGQGSNAAIFAARLRQHFPTEGAVTAEEDDNFDEDEVVSGQEEEEEWEMVSSNGEEGSVTHLEGDHSNFVEVSLERMDEVSDADDEAVEEGLPRGQPLREDAGGSYDLALKMVCNYHIASNSIAISNAFERECLPLWPSVSNGSFGAFHWENGHRAKQKGRRFLPPHPNIAKIHHAFVAPTVTHDLEEARRLFPAGLPTRLHSDGLGRNQTMFLVMKRYDMTLDEYNCNVGCPSQRVAMVIVAQLLEGVSHLVHHGIAHRDLKSNNILVELAAGSPRVVIADFGCCLADDTIGLHLPYPTKHMEIGGNSALMAPEVKSCRPGPNATIDYTKSDAWAIGAISYEILGLPNPFYCHGDSGAGLDSKLYEEGDLPGLSGVAHPGLARVVRLLLRKDPAMRPTAKVAANMLHLSLWQPPVFTVAWWEGSNLFPAAVSRQQHLSTWLLRLAVGLLFQRSPAGHQTAAEGEGRRSWLGDTEYQLCVTFMSRVTPSELLSAANYLVP